MKKFSTQTQDVQVRGRRYEETSQSARTMILHSFGGESNSNRCSDALTRGVFLIQVAKRMSSKLTGYAALLLFL